jgi:hypothetical protein
MYVRFVDPNGTYFGKSKYRPSEGWIDVMSFNWGRQGQQEAVVWIGNKEEPVVQLYQACTNFTPIDYAVVEVRNGAKWIRFVMNDVRIKDCRTNDPGAGATEPSCSILFTYKKMKDSYGGYPKVKDGDATGGPLPLEWGE